ncbi:MAG: radical SAM protein [Candidatus Omnitrophica bacterium]|nr:radical SAM protein [Candidatus Omnitrophota bacterium]
MESLESLHEKAAAGAGLTAEEAALFLERAGPEDWRRAHETACALTRGHFGGRLFFFAPLYFSSYCVNDCAYCGFRRSNRALRRRALETDEFLTEARFLWEQGHRTLLLVAAEHPGHSGAAKIAAHAGALRAAGMSFYLMAEVAPMSVPDYRVLRQAGISQCLLFQETYNREVYAAAHDGPKEDYEWRKGAMERALEAGISRVGLGILLGLNDYREDLCALIAHARDLRTRYGKFPATFSFPRLRSAYGLGPTAGEGKEVTDEQLERIIVLARLAVPSAGIVLSTRETPAFRDSVLKKGIGVTHLSAGSATAPGGYTLTESGPGGQFELLDHRPLGEVLRRTKEEGHRPCLQPN